MSIRYACEECSSVLNIKNDLSGTIGHCPKCKTEFTVPEAADVSGDDEISLVVDDDTDETNNKSGSSSRSKKQQKGKSSRRQKSSQKSAATEVDAKKTFSYKCDSCGAVMQIREDLAGKKGNCPKCKTEFSVPIQDMEQAIMNFLDEDPRDTAKARTTTSAFEHEFDDDDIEEDSVDTKPDEESSDDETSTEEETSVPDLARQLYKKMRKSEKSESDDGNKKKKVWGIDADSFDEKEGTDWKGILVFTGSKIIPIALGLILLVGGVYWVTVTSISGSSDIPPLGQVTGIVKLDGKPLAQATVMFQPITVGKMKTNVSFSSGRTNAAGEYTLSYNRDYEGAAVGNHLVTIEAQANDGSELLPARYNAKTTLRFEVKSGANTEDFDLQPDP